MDIATIRADGLLAYGPDDELTLVHDGCEPVEMRGRIERLKNMMLAMPDQFEPHVEHELTDGMYLRKMYIPKGTLLVGKVHLRNCHNVVASGDITVLTEFGAKRVRAGFTGMSSPGSQKVGLAHADTIFINIFRTDKTAIEDIEAEIACEAVGRGGLVCL